MVDLSNEVERVKFLKKQAWNMRVSQSRLAAYVKKAKAEKRIGPVGLKMTRDLYRDYTWKRACLQAAAKVKGSLWVELPKDAKPVAAQDEKRERCGRCAGTGEFITHIENGKPKGPGGRCYRCAGKGYRTTDDERRNDYYDNHAVPADSFSS